MEDSYRLKMAIESDENGYFDRRCPNEECQYIFKINLHDWEEKVSNEHVYCPRCGSDAPSSEWMTEEQNEVILENATSFALGLLHDELKSAFKDIEHTTRRNKFARITYKPGKRPAYIDLPITQSEEWATEIVCDDCGTRFSVIGNAYFCPCCGKDLTTNAIRDSLASYKVRIDSLGRLRVFFEEEYSPEEAEKQTALFREDTLGSLVGTFESFAKKRYEELGGKPQKGNVFQRVVDGSELFRTLIGKGYSESIGESGMSRMNLLFNRRHLITHNNGVVDERYLSKTGDDAYAVGQRIVLKDEDLNELLRLISSVVESLLSETKPGIHETTE